MGGLQVIAIEATYTGLIADVAKRHGVAKRGLPKLRKETLMLIAREWHRRYHRRHFTREAYQLYGYTPRSGEDLPMGSKAWKRSYTGRKTRMKKHRLPLVWSGASRTLAAIRDIRGTSRYGKAVLHCRGLNRRNPNSRIRMRDEVTRVNAREERSLIATGEKRWTKLLRRIKARRKVRKRG